MKSKRTRQNRLQWLLEPVEGEPCFFQKRMFGFQAAYLFGKLGFVLADKEEPWNGLLICTSHEFHSALIGEYPELRPHPVLGKWLYLPLALDSFEETAQKLVQQAMKKDPRIGVEPGGRRKRRSSKSREKSR